MNRIIVILIPLLLLGACGSAQQRTTRLLDQRLRDRLAPDIAAGRAVVQDVPDGVRVTLLESSLFPTDAKALDNQASDVRASVVEGLLDPRLMRMQVADTSALPPDQQDIRVDNVRQYFVANWLGSVLVPPDPAGAAAGAAPAGLAITIGVQCPPPDGYIGYRDGKARPRCE